MKTTTQLLGAVSAFALIAMSSAPALAQGTSAGLTIRNDVTVSYNVNGIAQNAATASDSFTVDRKVNVTVSYVGTATSVTPGQTGAVIAFDVSNLSNDTIDLALATALTSGNASNINNFLIYRDVNNNNTFDSDDLAAGAITYLDEVAEDAVTRVFVLSDISVNAANGNEFVVTLTANAHAGAGAGSLGTELVATAGANTAGIDTVLADGAGATDSANQGDFSANGTYVVAGAVVAVNKTSRIVSDPVNLGVNPKAIPGAVIEYCITVANTGSATASGVNITDDLPSDVSYLPGFGILVNGDAACTNGTSGGNFAAGGGVGGADRVTGTLSDIATGETRSLYFQVEIK